MALPTITPPIVILINVINDPFHDESTKIVTRFSSLNYSFE